MTTEEEHETIQDELEEDLNEKISRGIIGKRQKLIGFSTSEASVNLFARLLHKLNLISPGFNVNHRFFASLERAKEKFGFELQNKDKILELLVKQEKYRDTLCYGKNKDDSIAKEAVENYFKLKEMIENEIEKSEKNYKNEKE